MKLFDAFKQYIVNHPKEGAYKPTSNKYDRAKLCGIINELEEDIVEVSQDDEDKLGDFITISDYFHEMHNEVYDRIKKDFYDFNMKGVDIIEFFIADLNREYRVVRTKMRNAALQQTEGTYLYQDMMNPRLQLSPGAFVDTRAALEASTEAINMICNYLRFFLKEDFKNEDADPKMFASNVIRIYQMADVSVTFKHSYDDILFNGGFVKIDKDKHVLTFDYDDYHKLRLLTVGGMMFGERALYMNTKFRLYGKKMRLGKYVANYRIKRIKLQRGCVSLEFGQGDPKGHKIIAMEMESAIEAFYEYLDINVKLVKMGNILLGEALAVWTALRYICYESSERIDCDVSMLTKEQMGAIPRLFKKDDLIKHIEKLTGLNMNKVKTALKAFEADWSSYNDIWTSPLFLNDTYYSIPFFPIINCVAYNVIDTLLEKGGYDLNERGKIFEKYIYDRIINEKHEYGIVCSASKYYGTKENGEEIDLIVVLKDLVILGEAKCIHYSMDPQDYHNAWNRLSYGAEQAKKKAAFVEKNPELFVELGDLRGKTVLPIVVTNFPTFVGFEHDGVYVIDSHSLISYLNVGCITMRELSLTGNPIKQAQFFYNNEDEYSANFEQYLKKNPLKENYMPKVVVEDMTLMPNISPWKCYAKSAIYKGHPGFDIVNGPSM